MLVDGVTDLSFYGGIILISYNLVDQFIVHLPLWFRTYHWGFMIWYKHVCATRCSVNCVSKNLIREAFSRYWKKRSSVSNWWHAGFKIMNWNRERFKAAESRQKSKVWKISNCVCFVWLFVIFSPSNLNCFHAFFFRWRRVQDLPRSKWTDVKTGRASTARISWRRHPSFAEGCVADAA